MKRPDGGASPALTCATAYLLLLGVRAALALRHARRRHPRRDADEARLTVLQPILSGDPDLPHALADNLVELPGAAFVWCVDADDPLGARTAQQVAAAHPAARVRVEVMGPVPDGLNPKSVKLARAVGLLAGPLSEDAVLLVLDDDTRITRRGVLELVGALDTHDLATGLPAYRPAAGLPGRLVEQFVNSSSALTYLTLAAVGEPRSLNGMTYALTAGTLRRLGGFEAIAGTLVDDLAMAERVHAVGGTIAQCACVQQVSTTVGSGTAYLRLMHRWMLFARLLLERESAGGRATIVTLLGTPPPLLAATLALSARSAAGLPLAAVVLAARHLVIGAVNRRVGIGAPHPVLSPLAELLQPLHMAHALLSRTITWRSHRYVVHAADRFTEVAQRG